MRITLGHKLAAVVALLSLVAVGISIFALRQANLEQQRAAATEAVWNAGLQARGLAQSIEHAVVQATAMFTAADTGEAKARLSALQGALAQVEQARGPFLVALDGQLSLERKRTLDLAVKEFIAYQTDTAELGLTISPRAALIQASDAATVKNREAMVAEINALGNEVLARLESQRAEVAQAQRRAGLTLLVVPACALAIGLVAAFWIIATQIQAPLHRLRGSMQALAADRLDGAIPFTRRRDEVGEMAHAIRGFQVALLEKRRLDAHAEARMAEDIRRASALAEATRAFESETEGAVADLAVSAEALQAAADTLFGTAGDTTAQTARVATASDQSAGLIDSIAGAAEELSNAAREIEDRVRQTSEIASVALSDAGGLETTVTDLSRAAREIGAVVTLIRSVAEQTNLLALNATIEAARAGEAGRGFAVVAAEVKALASQTALATDRIAGQIEAIQTAADGTAGAIGSIGRTIAQMSGIATGVAAAADQQGQASLAIARAISGAAADARTVSDSIGGVRKAAASNEAQATQVRTSALRVNAGAHGLRDAIEIFLARVRAA
jgi:methyl-accepting chemotaxis protein